VGLAHVPWIPTGAKGGVAWLVRTTPPSLACVAEAGKVTALAVALLRSDPHFATSRRLRLLPQTTDRKSRASLEKLSEV